MALQRTIINLRNMQRSSKLRGEGDPAKVAAELEAILIEAVHMQNSGSAEFQQRALKELRQLRSDMTTGQINAGVKGNQFVGVYSHVIDQLERAVNESAASNDRSMKQTMGAVRDAFPSTDSLVAALMTANPLLGYSTKIMRDIMRSRKEAKESRKREAQRQLALVKEQEAYIQAQLEATQAPAEESPAEAAPSPMTEVYESLLIEIRDDIKKLESYWRGDDSSLEKIEETLDSELTQINENLVDQMDAAADAEANRIREEKLSRLKEGSHDKIPVIETVSTQAKKEEKHGGLLDAILGGPLRAIGGLFLKFAGVIGGILGIFGLSSLGPGTLKTLKGMFGFLGGLTKMLKPIAKRLFLPLAVITSIYEFFDGFFNADKIIGKMDSEISMGERITAAFANLVAGLISGIDSLLELFGIDLIDTTDLSKKLYNFAEWYYDSYMGLVEDAKNLGNSILDTVLNTYNSFTTGFMSIYESVSSGITTAIDDSMNAAKKIMDKITGTFTSVYKAIEAKIAEWYKTLSDIPGIGRLFKVEDEKIVVDPTTANRISNDLNSMSNTAHLLRIGDGTATMVPMMMTSASQNVTPVMMAAERAAARNAAPNNSVMVNAPTSVNNASTTVQSGNNTSNPNNVHRRLNDYNFGSR